MDWIGSDWIGLDWIGLDWAGLDWTGFTYFGPSGVEDGGGEFEFARDLEVGEEAEVEFVGGEGGARVLIEAHRGEALG